MDSCNISSLLYIDIVSHLVAPGALLFLPGDKKILVYRNRNCWAPWISQDQSTDLPSIFLRAQPCLQSKKSLHFSSRGFRFVQISLPLNHFVLLQPAKKVMSNSLGLVDFAIGLVIFFLNLSDEQVLFFWGNSNYRRIVINPSNQKGFGASWNDLIVG